jgi:hypothetical protein
MFLKIIFALVVGQVSYAVASDGSAGGQAVFCNGPSAVNTSLIAFDGLKKFRFSSTNLGGDLNAAMTNILSRLEKVSPARAELLKDHLQTFESKTAHLHGIDFLNQKDWDEEVIPAGCEVKKIIIHRRPVRAEDKEFLINEDLWVRLSPSTQATLILEQILLEFGPGYGPQQVVDVRKAVAYVVDDSFGSKNLFDFLNFSAKNISETCLDFLGASVGSRPFLKESSHYEVQLCRNYDGSEVLIQGSMRELRNDSTLMIDQGLHVTGAMLFGKQTFKLRNGKTVVLGEDKKNFSFSTFDSEGYPMVGYLAESSVFTNINNESIECKAFPTEYHDTSLINFSPQGLVTRCMATVNSRFGGLILLRDSDVQWCAGHNCPNNLENYFDTRTNTGKIVVVDFPSSDDEIKLDVTGFKEGQTDNSDLPNYGDFLLTIGDRNNDYFGPHIGVFANGHLASAALKKSVHVFSGIHIALAKSGRCGLFGESYVDTVKFDVGSVLLEGVIDTQTVFEDGNGNYITVPAKSRVKLNGDWQLLNYKQLCR